FVVLKTINLKDSHEILRKKLFKMGERIKNVISQQMKFKVSTGIGEYHKSVRGLSKSFNKNKLKKFNKKRGFLKIMLNI
ncbi:unnamed protein product, partial [marine sediment metagenome]